MKKHKQLERMFDNIRECNPNYYSDHLLLFDNIVSHKLKTVHDELRKYLKEIL